MALYHFLQVVAVLKKEVTKTHNESEHEDIGGYRQVTINYVLVIDRIKKVNQLDPYISNNALNNQAMQEFIQTYMHVCEILVILLVVCVCHIR